MKTNDLRNTVLILAGTLVATFVLSLWWMSRQAASLREVHKANTAAKEQLALLQMKRDNALSEMEVMRVAISELQRQMVKQPAKSPIGLLHRVKRGFNDIQGHVAKGEFAGLTLTDGYMELKEILDNPAFEEMLENDHGTVAPR